MLDLGNITKNAFVDREVYLFNPAIAYEAVVLGDKAWITCNQHHCAAEFGKVLMQTSVTGTTQFLPESSYERVNDYQISVDLNNPPCMRFSGKIQMPYFSNNPYRVDIAPFVWRAYDSGENASAITNTGLIEIEEELSPLDGERITAVGSLTAGIILESKKTESSCYNCKVTTTQIISDGNATATGSFPWYLEKQIFDDTALETQSSTYADTTLSLDTASLALGEYGFQIYEIEPQREVMRLEGKFTLV